MGGGGHELAGAGCLHAVAYLRQAFAEAAVDHQPVIAHVAIVGGPAIMAVAHGLRDDLEAAGQEVCNRDVGDPAVLGANAKADSEFVAQLHAINRISLGVEIDAVDLDTLRKECRRDIDIETGLACRKVDAAFACLDVHPVHPDRQRRPRECALRNLDVNGSIRATGNDGWWRERALLLQHLVDLAERQNRVGGGQGVETVLEQGFHQPLYRGSVESRHAFREMARQQVHVLRIPTEARVKVGVGTRRRSQAVAADQPLGEGVVAQEGVTGGHVGTRHVAAPGIVEVTLQRFLQRVEVVGGHGPLARQDIYGIGACPGRRQVRLRC